MHMMNRLEKCLCGGGKARKRLITNSSARTARRNRSSSIAFNKRPYRLRCSNCGKSILIGKISSK